MEYKRDRKFQSVDIHVQRASHEFMCPDTVLQFALIIFWKPLILVQNIKIRLFYDKELDERKENIVQIFKTYFYHFGKL